MSLLSTWGYSSGEWTLCHLPFRLKWKDFRLDFDKDNCKTQNTTLITERVTLWILENGRGNSASTFPRHFLMVMYPISQNKEAKLVFCLFKMGTFTFQTYDPGFKVHGQDPSPTGQVTHMSEHLQGLKNHWPTIWHNPCPSELINLSLMRKSTP